MKSPMDLIGLWTFTKKAGFLGLQQSAGAERKAFAAEVGRLISKLSENLQADENSNLQLSWVLELAEKIGSSQNTIRNWWSEFTKDSGLNLTPRRKVTQHCRFTNCEHLPILSPNQ